RRPIGLGKLSAHSCSRRETAILFGQRHFGCRNRTPQQTIRRRFEILAAAATAEFARIAPWSYPESDLGCLARPPAVPACCVFSWYSQMDLPGLQGPQSCRVSASSSNGCSLLFALIRCFKAARAPADSALPPVSCRLISRLVPMPSLNSNRNLMPAI